MTKALILLAALGLVLLSTPASASTAKPWQPVCQPKCYGWPRWHPKDCPWKKCGHEACYFRNNHGVWKKGFRCVPRVSPSPSPSTSPKPHGPPTTCPNKCYVKWIQARQTCNFHICKIQGCPIWAHGRRKWGFRCVALPVAKPTPSSSPTPSPSPEPRYPAHCPTLCRRWKGAVVTLCDPAKCVVQQCQHPWKWWKHGWNCVPIPPTPAPSTTPTATPSASPKPSYEPVAPVCEGVCRRNRWRVMRSCDPTACMVKGCRHPWKWWKWGFACVEKEAAVSSTPTATPTASPSAAPVVKDCAEQCENKWYWPVRSSCNVHKCRVVRCGRWKAWKCTAKKW